MIERVPLNILYEKCGPVNGRRLSELIKSAQGSRTINAFSRDIGVPASTVSRMMKQNGGHRHSAEILERIAYFADKNSGVTLDDLMQANGFRLRREDKEPKTGSTETTPSYFNTITEMEAEKTSLCEKRERMKEELLFIEERIRRLEDAVNSLSGLEF